MSNLVRAVQALRRVEDAVTAPGEVCAFGAVLRCADAPTLGPLNFVRVDTVGEDVSATVAAARGAANSHGLATIVLDAPPPVHYYLFEGPSGDGDWYRVPRCIYACEKLVEEPTEPVERVSLDEFITARRAFIAASDGYDIAQAAEEEAATRLLAAKVETEQWGAYVDGELASIGETYFSDGVAQLESLSTLPDREGRGLGTAVTAARAKAALQSGAELVFAQIRYDNTRSIGIHERVGFTHIGARTTFELLRATP